MGSFKVRFPLLALPENQRSHNNYALVWELIRVSVLFVHVRVKFDYWHSHVRQSLQYQARVREETRSFEGREHKRWSWISFHATAPGRSARRQ